MSGQVPEADTIGAASSVATECDPGGTVRLVQIHSRAGPPLRWSSREGVQIPGAQEPLLLK